MELWGKPLHGLTPVSIAAVLAHPERYKEKPVCLTGTGGGEKGHPVIRDGKAALLLLTDGSFSLPEDLEGTSLRAEGRVEAGPNGPALLATGVEVRR